MNITSKSLYGDLDGLARSIRMQTQILFSLIFMMTFSLIPKLQLGNEQTQYQQPHQA